MSSSGQFGEGRFWNMLRTYDATMVQVDSAPFFDYTDEMEREELPGAWKVSLSPTRWIWAQVLFYGRPYEALTVTGDRPPRGIRRSRNSRRSSRSGPGPPQRLDPSRVPETKPPLYGLSADDRGRVWVRLTPPEVEPTRFDVFGPDGVHAETVEVGGRVDAWIPPLVRGDRLWAVGAVE